jgi:hypothetical protein
MALINVDALMEAAEDCMFGMSNAGFCIACGEESDGCEPDARNYPCDACGKRKVFGAPELILMGYADGID